MAIYDIAGAMRPFDPVGSLQQGMSYVNALRDLAAKRAEDQRQTEIRNGLMQFYRQAQPERREQVPQGMGLLDMASMGAAGPGQLANSPMPSALSPMGRLPNDGFGRVQSAGMIPTTQERTIPATPASYDFEGAQNWLASQGAFNQLQALQQARGSSDDESFGVRPEYGYDKDGKLVPLQYGSRGTVKRAQLPDGIASLAFPTEYKDSGGAIVALPKFGNDAPRPVVTKEVDPSTIYSNEQQNSRLERGAQLEVQTSEEKKRREAAVSREIDVGEQVRGAQDAITDLNTLEGALKVLPSPAALFIEGGKGWVGLGDPKVQEALGQAKVVSGRMLKYVERLPGAATDKDRETFMASAGVLSNDSLPVQQRIAAARTAKEAYQRLLNKYGKPADQVSTASQPGWKAAGYRNILEAHADYKKARDSAYKAGNYDLVRRIDEEARKDGVIR